jgi:IS605 OrfB family transposase
MTHRYRLCPDDLQVKTLMKHCSDARAVWNVALEQANFGRERHANGRWRNKPGMGPSPGPATRQRQLAEARACIDWLAAGSSSVQQQALRDFDNAMKRWAAGTHGRPTWRKKDRHEGFCVRDVTVARRNRRWATIQIPKSSRVRFRLSRPLPAAYGMARVTKDCSGRWHVSFLAPQPTLERQGTGAVVGIDLGVVVTVATSDGVIFSAPGLRPDEAQRLRRLQRKLSRQRKGSRRREHTKVSVARLRAKEADRRKDFIEQLSTDLVRRHDLIAIEDLHVKHMVRSAKGTPVSPGIHVSQKRGLNRAIYAQGWAALRHRLEDKAATCGVQVVAVDPKHTSQCCAACGHTAPENRESQADFSCRACRHEANADVNAACNILAAGLVVTARGGTPGCGPNEARTLPGKARHVSARESHDFGRGRDVNESLLGLHG